MGELGIENWAWGIGNRELLYSNLLAINFRVGSLGQ